MSVDNVHQICFEFAIYTSWEIYMPVFFYVQAYTCMLVVIAFVCCFIFSCLCLRNRITIDVSFRLLKTMSQGSDFFVTKMHYCSFYK